MIADLLARLRALVLRRRWERELGEEMAFHLEQESEVHRRAGADPETAGREARLAFGGVDRYKEATRDASGVRPVEETAADVRFAWRWLRRSPGFTLTAVAVLALALGAVATVFAVVHAVLWAPLPYPHADRLVRIYEQNSPTNIWSLSVVDYQAIRDQQRSFDAVGAARFTSAELSGVGQPEEITAVRVTSGFFTALGVGAAAGRLIEGSDEPVGASPVAVVSDGFARAHWGSPGAAVGRVLTLDGLSHTVVGVLSPGVEELAGMRASVWPVYQMAAPTRRGPFGLRGIARLKPDVSLEGATRDLAAISERIYPIWESGFKDKVARLTPYPLRRTIVGNAEGELGLFGGAVGLIFLVAVANVATLVLVRASTRQHELALRATLGASRLRLVRLVLTECFVITGLATALGIWLAAAAVSVIGRIAPDLPRGGEVSLDGTTILVALALGAVSGLVVGGAPAIGVLRGTLSSWREDTRRAGGGRRVGRLRGILVASEFALAVPLLLAAGLLGRSFLALVRVNPGYDPSHSFSVRMALPAARYPDSLVQDFWRRAVLRVSSTPGVLAVGLSTSPPPDTHGDVNNFNLVAHPVPEGGAEPVAPWPLVTPGFFRALAVPLLVGRGFTDADSVGTPPVAIVSRSWADHYFPNEDPVGQQLVEGGCYACPRTTVVGVVGDVKYEGLEGNGDAVYEPMAQSLARGAALVVRTADDPALSMGPVLDQLRTLDPAMPLRGVPMADDLREAVSDPGRWTTVLLAFGAVALGLSAIGIFGLMSYVVRRERREIGVRLALGAEPRRVAVMIVGRGMRHVVAGTLAGLALTMLEARWLGSLLYGVTAHDGITTVAVVAILLATASLACLLPGFAAARLRPLEAIATE